MSVLEVGSIAIIGGGTAGWMTAAALSHHFKDKVQITLVESSKIGTVGVGEATIPSIRRFYARLGLSDQDVIKATGATCKLGIEFRGWGGEESSFIHPFGLFGQPLHEVPFHHLWKRATELADVGALEEYSLGINLAKHNKFCLPEPVPSSMLTIFDWALHFDASRFAGLMQDCAVKQGVRLIDDIVCQVERSEQGIGAIVLESGKRLCADLYIDCSGFKGLLIEQALQTGYESWEHWLYCDRAVAVQSEAVSNPLVRTVATARKAGWQWAIPLQHRCGNGHVFSSRYISEDEATQILLDNTTGPVLHQPRSFHFTPGRRKLAWNKNCVAIGLASGFLEPLESTSIAMIETAIERLLLTFRQPVYRESDVTRFNDVSRMEFERIRDFIILHYKANQRQDSAFWQDCRTMDLPAELAYKIKSFRQQGQLDRLPWEIFGPDSWLAIFHGLGVTAERYPAKAEEIDESLLLTSLQNMRQRVQKMTAAVPVHQEFLRRFAGYQPKDANPDSLKVFRS
ncbi:MAG: tryptophan 7-halogenase [Alkalimonas sp.]|nr:tryptophan 7-halogenase [Alkalimonas sp.]